MTDFESHRQLQRLMGGDESAATQLYNRYAPRLRGLVQKRIATRLKRRFDPEDILQSVYRSFFRRAKEGSYHLERSGALWGLLAGIAANKLRNRVGFENAQKRTPDSEIEMENGCDYLPNRRFDPVASMIMEDELKRLMGQLPLSSRQILELRLRDMSIPEIAVELKISESTVRRRLNNIDQRLQSRFGDTDPPPED